MQALENVLTTMVASDVPRIIFPSSGGTIYGEIGHRPARETDELRPLSSYGMGKLLSEQIIRFYHRLHNIEYSIMRIANAYGAKRLERISQGLIDVFLEKCQAGEELVLWGDVDQVRDYIFVDDVMDAMLGLLDLEDPLSTIVNVGSGSGTSIGEVLSIMKKVIGHSMQWKVKGEYYAGIPYNVLDITKITKLIGWTPRYTLQAGIEETWHRKRATE
jgi:UDP-glucose 4-epimerase